MSERDDRREDRRYDDKVTFRGRRRPGFIVVPPLPWREPKRDQPARTEAA